MTEKRGRKPNTPRLDRVFEAMERGDYDNDLQIILDHVAQRQNALKNSVMERVKQVFGPAARVIEQGVDRSFQGREGESQHGAHPNLFIQKAASEVRDSLDGLSGLDETERQMEDEGGPGRGGAVISGLSSSQIAD